MICIEFVDKILKLDSAFYFSSFLLKAIVLVLLSLFLIRIQSSLYVMQNSSYLIFVVFILFHVIQCLGQSFLIFFEASSFFQQFINLKLVHQSDLCDFSLLNDVVRIGVSKAQTFNKCLKLMSCKGFIICFELFIGIIMPYSLQMLNILVIFLLVYFTLHIQLHFDHPWSWCIYPSLC